MSDYVVVVRAEADARFPQQEGHESLSIDGFPTPIGPAQMTFRTRFADEGFDSPVPRDMWVDIRLSADASFLEAINASANAANALLPLIGFSANAWVGDADVHLAYDATPGLHERAFFENFLPERPGTLPRPGRNVDVPATISLGNTLPREDRLMRAVAQYGAALSHWMLGHETMALAHLYMGVDALTPLAVKREAERIGGSQDDLASHWGITERRRAVRRTLTAAAARRDILFKGDDATHRRAKAASDAFEHGYGDFAAIRADALAARDATARFLREAILDLGGVDATTQARLLGQPFNEPMRSFLTRYMWGRLVADTDELAPPGAEYPILEWSSRLTAFSRNEDRTYSMTPEETITARLAEGVQFQPTGYEVWGPTSATPNSPDGPADEASSHD